MDNKLVSKKEKSGKNGIVKDDNGYYKIALGAFNTYNASGIYYRLKDPSILLQDDTILKRRVTTGNLRAEEEHPDYKGLSSDMIIPRTVKIDLTRVCGHIKSIEFYNTNRTEKGWDGYNIFIVYGWVKPTGPYGKYLEESLSNPDENVAFSVRSLVKQSNVGATVVRDVVDVSTWDHVYEPGISIANQWYAAGIEEMPSVISSDDVGVCVDGVCNFKDYEAVFEDSELCVDMKCLNKRLNDLDTKGASLLDW